MGLFLIISIVTICVYAKAGKMSISSDEAGDRTDSISSTQANSVSIDKKYLPLLQFKSNDYESMSVADFRNMIFDAIDKDSIRYLTLLDDAFADKELQNLRYTDDDSSFICNLLVPICTDSWQNYHYEGLVLRNESNKNYIIEFSIQYEIIEPNNLKIAEFEEKLCVLSKALTEHLNEYKLVDLEDEDNREKEVISIADNVLFDISSAAISFTENYVDYSKLDGSEPILFFDSSSIQKDQMDLATNDDIEMLLTTFKTEGYGDLSILDYRTQIAKAIDDDSNLEKIINRVRFALAENQEVSKQLSESQYNFLVYTMNASLSENYIEGAQQYSSDKLLPNIRVQQYLDDPSYILDYRLYYEISSETKTTVQMRDDAIYAIISEIEEIVKTSETAKLTNSDLLAKCKEIVLNYNNPDINFSIESFYCIQQ